MAASSLPAPGTKLGPCAIPDQCRHKDCDETRAMADTCCGYCRDFIGYERRFYRVEGLDLVHAECHEDAVDRELREVKS